LRVLELRDTEYYGGEGEVMPVGLKELRIVGLVLNSKNCRELIAAVKHRVKITIIE
jgi:hypothetical protein